MSSARWLLLVLLVAAFALRAWDAGWGLPFTYHPDEHQYVDSAVAMLSGDLDPGRFTNPTLLKYGYALLFAVVAATGRLFGQWPSMAAFQDAFAADPTSAYVLARLVTALLGTVTVALTYRLGRRVYGRTAGLVAAALLAATFLHARDGHFATNDVLTALLATWALEFAVRLARRPRGRELVLGAAVVGLAAATKYSAAASALPLALGYILGPTRMSAGGPRGAVTGAGSARAAWPTAVGGLPGWLRRLVDGRLLLAGIVACAVFLAAVPYAVIRPQPFIADLAQLAARGRAGFKGVAIDPAPGWVFYIKSLAWGMGPLMLAVAIAGLARAVARRRAPAEWVLASLPLLMWGYLGGQLLMFARFMIPALPALAVLAAGVVVAIGRAVASAGGDVDAQGPSRDGARAIGRRPALTAAALTALLVAQPLASALRFDVLLGREDTRTEAKRWLEANVPEGTAVLVQSNGPELAGADDPAPPPRTTRRFRLTELDTLELPEQPPEAWRDAGNDVLVVSSFSSDRRLLDAAKDAAHRAYYARLAADWPLIAEFRPYAGDAKPLFVFAQLYGPATEVYRFDRPGPVIRVYDLNRE